MHWQLIPPPTFREDLASLFNQLQIILIWGINLLEHALNTSLNLQLSLLLYMKMGLGAYTVKKGSGFPSPAGMSLTKHSLAGKNFIIPGQGEFGTAGDGKTANIFVQCMTTVKKSLQKYTGRTVNSIGTPARAGTLTKNIKARKSRQTNKKKRQHKWKRQQHQDDSTAGIPATTGNSTGTVGMTASISRDSSKIWDAKVEKSETAV
jgi:hypothetical protein